VSEVTHDWVRAFAPASVGNVTCGFDLLGFAVAHWGDTVEARTSSEPGVQITKITGDNGRLPTDPRKNTAGVAALELLRQEDRDPSTGVELRLHKGLPLASGLGSSGASGVAAAVAVDALLGLEAGPERLLAAAVESERVACGTPLPDNAAPSLHGGLVLSRGGPTPAIAITRLHVPKDLTCVLLHPHAEVATAAARAVLPAQVSLETSLLQSGNLAALVAGLLTEDYDLIASAMVDHIAEPVRTAMTPGFEAVRNAALAAGALGCGLSGSGPTIFAWCRNPALAAPVETAMREGLRGDTGLDADTLVTPVGAPGARVLEHSEAAPGEPA